MKDCKKFNIFNFIQHKFMKYCMYNRMIQKKKVLEISSSQPTRILLLNEIFEFTHILLLKEIFWVYSYLRQPT